MQNMYYGIGYRKKRQIGFGNAKQGSYGAQLIVIREKT